jgi:hypothetical protein
LRTVVSLTLSSRPICIQWQDKVKTAGDEPGCSGWPAVSYVSHCALIAFHNALLGPPFCPLDRQKWISSAQSVGSSLFEEGDKPWLGLPSGRLVVRAGTSLPQNRCKAPAHCPRARAHTHTHTHTHSDTHNKITGKIEFILDKNRPSTVFRT